MITEYDPNINWSRHTIKVTFMQWDYLLTMEVEVTGNCSGFTIFDSAISACFDKIYDTAQDIALLLLDKPAEDGVGDGGAGVDTLEITVEDDDELQELCVGIEIVAHVEELKS